MTNHPRSHWQNRQSDTKPIKRHEHDYQWLLNINTKLLEEKKRTLYHFIPSFQESVGFESVWRCDWGIWGMKAWTRLYRSLFPDCYNRSYPVTLIRPITGRQQTEHIIKVPRMAKNRSDRIWVGIGLAVWRRFLRYKPDYTTHWMLDWYDWYPNYTGKTDTRPVTDRT